MENEKLEILYLPLSSLRPAEYNPRKHSKEALEELKKSLSRFGAVDPIIVNGAPKRLNIVFGGDICPYSFNKNTGEFDWKLLTDFSEDFLKEVGFSSEELDDIFKTEEIPEMFDLKKELAKLDITNISIKKGEVYDFDGSRMMCGDSTIETDMLKLMGDEKADMVLTDPPYILDYLRGKKKNGKATEGFGAKRDRRYLETDSLPDNFTELWMGNISKIAKPDFHIIVYENWKNIRTIWGAMEQYWKVRNMIVWHLPNRVQGFAARYKFFNKHDIALVGSSEAARNMNLEP